MSSGPSNPPPEDAAARTEEPESSAVAGREARKQSPGTVQRGRMKFERGLTRLIVSLGIVGIGVALGAILGSSKVTGWIIGLVVSGVTILLAAILWSSRQLKPPREINRPRSGPYKT